MLACKILGFKEASIGKTIAIGVPCHSQNCSYSVLIKSPSWIALCGQMVKIFKKKTTKKNIIEKEKVFSKWLQMIAIGRGGGGHKTPKNWLRNI